MPSRFHSLVVALLLGCCFAPLICADDNAKGLELYEKQVRPLLQKHCYKCHSHDSDKVKGGLLVDSREAMLAGGESGETIVPGKPDESLLLQVIRHEDGWKMPPTGPKLADAEIATIAEWVRLGAPAPKSALGGLTKRTGKITEEDKRWWSFQPVANPAPPKVKNEAWPKNDIDRFVLARLETEGLSPAPEAEQRALVRRLYYNLIGLPPTPTEVAEFIDDKSSDAYERLVDRLLASPHYGEKWARHWLDLVRYADSDGYRIDDYRPHAWRYRDYVIRSFNDDKPYDRFVREQLAGDELFPDDPEASIATGFLCHWIYEYNNRDAEGQWRTILNDVTDTTSDVFLGMGLQCARCHDHKFDPLLQKDYYRLQAYFAALNPYAEETVASREQRADHAERSKKWEAATAEIRGKIAALEEKYRDRARKDAIGKFPEEVKEMILKQEQTPYEKQISELALRQVTYEYNRLDGKLKGDDKEAILALRKQLADFENLKPGPLPAAMIARDIGPHASPVLIPKKGKDPIEPGILSVLDEAPAVIPSPADDATSTGRRTALANWIADPKNPLTARVIVNRVWQVHFGQGLAANASDFGKLGEAPSHPELLDWLASRFIAEGWSIKKLHKRILLSATYRQSVSHPDPAAGRLKDPTNRLYWRGNTRRLDAEQIRDGLFAVAGELKLQPGGPGVNSADPRRSVYCRIMRNTRDPLFDVFDAPAWFQSAASRDTTTTPVQSLLLFNSQFMLKRAEGLAAQLKKDGAQNEEQSVVRGYERVFSRKPSDDELAAALKFLHEQQQLIDPVKTGSAQAKFLFDKMPLRDGQAAILNPEGPQNRFIVPHADMLPRGDFTVESYVLLRSVYETGTVRTIAAKWNGDMKQPGWGFGVTGKKSRRKPQTLVLQFIGKKLDGSVGEEALFSDQSIQLNKPYYFAASVTLARDGKEGSVSFYVKDLSNDDEPLLHADVPHKITGGFENDEPLTFGGRMGTPSSFDGLIDDVRLSDSALAEEQLLYTNEGVNARTIGYWQFEAKPDVFRDVSGHGYDIRGSAPSKTKTDTSRAAMRDFCHILLNSNEFLYVE